jgi:ABC-type multidrug transport system fused ATPase/permease subunit
MAIYLLLFGDLMRRLSWRFPVLIACSALVGLGEGVSVLLLLPLLNRAGVVAASTQGLANAFIEKGLAFFGADTTSKILLLVIVVATAQMTLSLAFNWWSIRLGQSYQSHRRLELFGAFMRAKWVFIADLKAGEMTNAIVTECERLGRVFIVCLSLLGSGVVTLIYLLLSAFVAWQVTLCLAVFAIAGGLTMAGLYKKNNAFGQNLAPLHAQLQFTLDEQFAGAKFIKTSVGLARPTAQIELLVRKLVEINTFTSAMPGTVRGLLEYIALIGLAAILVLTSLGFGVAPANVLIVLALFARVFPRLTTVQAQLYSLNANVHAIGAINELQTAAEAEAEPHDDSSEPLRIERPTTLAVRNLQVRFGERVVLDQINLTLPIPGLLAVVGRSGAGKSTLVHTLLGLVEPSAGSLRLGSHVLGSAPLRAWRRTIGYVPQETILFHTSIRENLTLVNPAASAAAISAAARRAHALDFINLLPRGFDTIIGDRGVKLSGGQRQRLGIARALLANPALLVMDEAMSALDAESEAELLRTLEDLRQQMGILLVAHRLAAARTADIVCVFEAGRLVEAGAWNELMARKGRLYALAETQSPADERLVGAL